MRDRVLRTTTYNVEGPGPESFIRPAADEDAPHLAKIMPLAFPPGSKEGAQYSSPELMRLMILGFNSDTAREAWFSFLVAAHPAGGVAGAVVFRYGMHSNEPFMPPVYKDVAVLDTLAVAPNLRHRGIGRALLRRAEADMRIAGARVIALQCPITAAGFYDRCGYRVEAEETCCLTFFPRQGQKVFTTSRPRGDGEQRLAWRSLTGARTCSTPYTHASRGEPAMMVRGAIPGDGRRFPDWPTPTGYRLTQIATFGGA